ncbi:MAG: FG-GAP-like repeat-containing protein [Hyphomicrobiales bacterium]
MTRPFRALGRSIPRLHPTFPSFTVPLAGALLALFGLVAPGSVPTARAAALCPILIGTDIQDVAVADFDGDGLADVAAADAGAARVGLLFGQSAAAPARTGGAVITGVPIARVVAGDVDGDGNADIVAFSLTAGYMKVLLGHGDGTFSLGNPIATLANVNQVRGVDLNGDGRMDLVTLQAGATGSLAVQLADGAGGYGPPTTIWTGTLSIDDLAAGDIDGDHVADLATLVNDTVGGVQTATIRLFHGHGDGSFTELVPVAGPAGLSAIAIGDMNEDGRGDLVGASSVGSPTDIVSIWAGQADGSLGPETRYAKPLALGAGRAVLADLNGDGHLDLALLGGPIFGLPSGCGGNTLASFLGHGDGTLADTGVSLATVGASLGLGIGDLNGDGKADAVVAGAGCGDVAVHPGAGDGTFTTLTNPMRAFTDKHNDAIHVNNNKPSWCVFIEPVDSSFDVLDAPTSSLHLISEGTGTVSDITAGIQKETVVGDADGNQIQDVKVCFPKDRLQQLFSNVNGKQTLTLRLEAQIHDSACKVGTTITIDVFAGGKGNTAAALVRPNPLNPVGTLSFRTDARGPLRVRVFDVAGRLVRTLRVEPEATAGYHDVTIDGRDDAGRPLASGIYLYRIDAAGVRTEGRFVVAK